jgi:hypothetical protein
MLQGQKKYYVARAKGRTIKALHKKKTVTSATVPFLANHNIFRVLHLLDFHIVSNIKPDLSLSDPMSLFGALRCDSLCFWQGECRC